MSAINVSVAICQLPTCQFSAFGKKALGAVRELYGMLIYAIDTSNATSNFVKYIQSLRMHTKEMVDDNVTNWLLVTKLQRLFLASV